MVKKAKVKESKWKSAVKGNVDKQKAQSSNTSSYLKLTHDLGFFKVTPGSKIRLDFLPYVVTNKKHPDRDDTTGAAVPGSEWYRLPFKVHRNIGANNETVVCPTTFGKKCPICAHKEILRKNGEASDDDMKALAPQRKNLYIVVPRGVKDYEEKPYIWEMSQFLFQDVLNEELEENDDNTRFPDLDEGLTLKIRFTEESFNKSKFAKTHRIDFEERDEPISKKIRKLIPNLDELLQVLSYDELSAKFFDEEDSDDDDDDEPKKKRSIVDDDDDEDEEDEAPRKRKKLSAKKRLEEEDEDEDDDDDIDSDDEDEDEDDSDEDSDSDDDDEDDAESDNDEEEEEEEEEEPKPRKKKQKR